jgi:hypothetical protein
MSVDVFGAIGFSAFVRPATGRHIGKVQRLDRDWHWPHQPGRRVSVKPINSPTRRPTTSGDIQPDRCQTEVERTRSAIAGVASVLPRADRSRPTRAGAMARQSPPASNLGDEHTF